MSLTRRKASLLSQPLRALASRAICAVFFALASTARADWPQFRGADAGRVSDAVAKTLPVSFDGPLGKNILWRSPISLPGESSPIVVGHSVIVTGASLDKRTVFCLDTDNGKLLWQTEISAGGKIAEEAEPVPDTGFAAPTPACDGKTILVAFANGDFAGLDLAGKILWTKNFPITKSSYGYAASPALDGSHALIQLDLGTSAGDGLSKLICLDLANGKTLWETPRPVPNSWASPLVVNYGDNNARQIITAADPYAIAYDADTGKELWRMKCLGVDTACSPAASPGAAYVCGPRQNLTAISLDSTGEIPKSKRKWKTDDVEMPECSSPVANDKFVFIAHENGTIACFDAKTGQTLWSEEIPTSKKDIHAEFRSSPILIGSELWIIDRDGTLYRFAADKEFKVLSTSPLGEKTDAQPAYAENRIYVRGKENLYCIGTK